MFILIPSIRGDFTWKDFVGVCALAVAVNYAVNAIFD